MNEKKINLSSLLPRNRATSRYSHKNVKKNHNIYSAFPVLNNSTGIDSYSARMRSYCWSKDQTHIRHTYDRIASQKTRLEYTYEKESDWIDGTRAARAKIEVFKDREDNVFNWNKMSLAFWLT